MAAYDVTLDYRQLDARSDAMGPAKTSASGQSLRFRYAKSLAATDTNFSLIGYRYSTGGYYSFSEALNSRNAEQSLGTYRSGHMKSNFTANLSQQLGGYGGVYANVTKTDYWNKTKADTSIQLGYTVSSGSISYSLGLGLNKGAASDERTLSLSLSMPLGSTRNQRVTASANQSARGTASRTATLSGNAFADNTLAYSVGVSQQVNADERQAGGSVAARYDAPNATVHGAYNETAGNRQLDMGIEGSVVAYDRTLIFSQPLGETNVIVATPGAAGVGISNKPGVRTNANGYTVVPQALPYRSDGDALLPANSAGDMGSQPAKRLVDRPPLRRKKRLGNEFGKRFKTVDALRIQPQRDQTAAGRLLVITTNTHSAFLSTSVTRPSPPGSMAVMV